MGTEAAVGLKTGNHLLGVGLLLVTFLVGVSIWIAVQSTRPDPLPTLVWSPGVPDSQTMAASPRVLDRLGGDWWWIYATPKDREALRAIGVRLALALPTPLAQMAGCSVPAAKAAAVPLS